MNRDVGIKPGSARFAPVPRWTVYWNLYTFGALFGVFIFFNTPESAHKPVIKPSAVCKPVCFEQ